MTAEAQEWTFVDRTGWPAGPWDGEPDKVQWVDEKTDLDCLIVRQAHSGHLCGYVGVPDGHPLHGVDFFDLDDKELYLSAHGGVNYSAACDEDSPETGICHVPLPGRADDVWWFGFDCHHAYDLAPQDLILRAGFPKGVIREFTYKGKAYVESEVRDLAAQLKSLAS